MFRNNTETNEADISLRHNSWDCCKLLVAIACYHSAPRCRSSNDGLEDNQNWTQSVEGDVLHV